MSNTSLPYPTKLDFEKALLVIAWIPVNWPTFWWSFSCNSQSFQLPLVIGSYNCCLNLGKFGVFVVSSGILSDEVKEKEKIVLLKRFGRGRRMKKAVGRQKKG